MDQTDELSTRIHYVMAVARALVSSGKPVSPLQVYDWLETNGLRRARNDPTGTDGDQHFQKEVRFARQELADGGLVRSVDGRWAIEHIDGLLSLTPDAVREMIRRNRRDRDDRHASGKPAGSYPSGEGRLVGLRRGREAAQLETSLAAVLALLHGPDDLDERA